MTQALSLPYQQARQMIQKAPAKNVDETGWKRAGRFLWVWVAATRSLAVFHLDPCRNRDAMHQLLGQKIKGTICTDRFGVYQKVPIKRRGLCWSHLKRDFKELAEAKGSPSPQKGPAKKIGDAGLELCARVFDLWHQFRGRKITRSGLTQLLIPVQKKMHRLLTRSIHSPAKRTGRLCRQLLRLEPVLWTFAGVKGIEPTNNHQQPRRAYAASGGDVAETEPGIAFAGRLSIRRTRDDGIANAATARHECDGRAMDYLQRAIHALRCGVSPPPMPSAN